MRGDTHSYRKLRTSQGCEVHPRGNPGFSDYEDLKKSEKNKKQDHTTGIQGTDCDLLRYLLGGIIYAMFVQRRGAQMS